MLTIEELIERILELALIGRPNKDGANLSDIALGCIVEVCEKWGEASGAVECAPLPNRSSRRPRVRPPLARLAEIRNDLEQQAICWDDLFWLIDIVKCLDAECKQPHDWEEPNETVE